MSCLSALEIFIQRYISAYQDALSELPRYYHGDEDSVCIVKSEGNSEPVLFSPFKRKNQADFANIEHALELSLHKDIHAFYGNFYSAPLLFNASFGDGELIQAWNQQDFEYLQQNIIGHLMMKQKLKQPLTWFIGIMDDTEKMITVDNELGSVWLEVPGDVPKEKLADTLSEFIAMLSPRVAPPTAPIVDDTIYDHPGIWQRIKMMWQHLRGKRNY